MTFNDAYPTVHGPLISADPIFSKSETLKISNVYKYQVSEFIFKMYQQHSTNTLSKLVCHESQITWLSYKVKPSNITDGTKINNLFIPSTTTTNYGLKH